MVLSGFQIPRGTKVFRAGLVTSTDAANFPEPQRFLPERWLRGDPQFHQSDAFANLPFGHGPRGCIGQRFAKLELYMVAAKVVQHYRLEHRGEEVGLRTGFLNAPDKDICIKFTER